MKRLRFVFIVLFLAAICFPALQMWFHFFEEFEDAEKRELAASPHWGVSPAGKVPQECEAYVDDHFGMRPDLIRLNNLIRIRLFGVSPASSIVVGKESWLFYCSEALADGNSFNDYMGAIPLGEVELESLRLRLEENNRRFAEKGIVYIVAIAPNKNTVYDEYLPDRIAKSKGRTRLDQFVDHMREKSKLKILDLRPPLLAEKEHVPVYWATDSHWNTYGAYIGYREIMKRISEALPEAGTVPMNGQVSVRMRANGGDLAQILFMHDVTPEQYNTVFELDTRGRPKQFEKIVFRHDSFGDSLYPYLRNHFRKIVNIAPFAPFQFERIFDEKPEIVLHIFAERYLTQAVHDDFYYQDK